jgi:hypothetical protein
VGWWVASRARPNSAGSGGGAGRAADAEHPALVGAGGVQWLGGGAGGRVELRVVVRVAHVAGPGGALCGSEDRWPRQPACVGWVAVRVARWQ